MPAVDDYQGYSSLSSQGEKWVAVAPSDANDLPKVPKALYFNSAGAVALQGSDGHSEVFQVAAQQMLDVRPTRVLVTGTTVAAGGIIAIY